MSALAISKYTDLFRISVRQVFRQKKRYLGVLISIALGTAGVIIILTMGDDVKKNLNKDLELMGGATVMRAWFVKSHTAKGAINQRLEFDDDAIDAVRKLPGIASVSVITIIEGYTNWKDHSIKGYTLHGVDGYYWDVITVRAVRGHFFTNDAVEKRQRVCVLGEKLAKKIFGSTDVIGKHVPIRSSLYKVVGILGGSNAGEKAGGAFIPYTTIKDRLPNTHPPRMYIRCATWDDVPVVAEEVPKTISKYQPVSSLRLNVPYGPLKHLKRIVFWVEMFIIFSVVATLAIGGFGIWNGMMTAVKARTREIGLQKAMGAEDGDILFQFLTEAVTLSVGAVVLGIILGRGGIELSAWLLGSVASEELFFTYSGLTLGFSMILGASAGLLPSIRASRMEVVTAIRYE